jgi:hypothetical protein
MTPCLYVSSALSDRAGVIPRLAASALRSARKMPGVVSIDLHHVKVHALGVDGVGKPTVYWLGLERFWTRYFQESGATLDSFSVLRELSPLPGSNQMQVR